MKFLWITCRNLLTQSTNVEELKKALQTLELIVTVEHFMTETTQYSDLVLPATTQFEEWDIVASYWHHWISINQPAIEPYYESKCELEIARLLSKKLNEYKDILVPFQLTWKMSNLLNRNLLRNFIKPFILKIGVNYLMVHAG